MAATRLTQEQELRQLLAALRAWGIEYLTAGEATDGVDAGETRDAASFLPRLARAPQARVRDAVVSLLLLHPALANAARRALADAEPAVRERLITLAMAALYLRRIWWTQLTLALGHSPELSETLFADLWKERGLPPPWREHGEAGLRALERWEQGRQGTALNFAGDWQNQARQLMLQEWSRRADRDVPLAPIPRPPEAGEPATTAGEEDAAMSMRPPVDRARIEMFLQRLGQAVRQPGRVYLVGGAELVHGQVRGPAAATVDIDLWLDVRDEHEVQTALQQLKNALDVNVELASPGDFIPLPAAWQSAARYVGRYGPLDVFYFDFYSLALSKIERGTERDLEDVELLAQQGLIMRDRLDAAFQEILPRVGMGRYFNVDARRYAARYATAVGRAWGGQP